MKCFSLLSQNSYVVFTGVVLSIVSVVMLKVDYICITLQARKHVDEHTMPLTTITRLLALVIRRNNSMLIYRFKTVTITITVKNGNL